MKKGFTLIELLITVTVMATLMAVMFKIGTSSSDETARIKTITRMQKLENCLSGYYAAFGSYPPVKIYGSRDIYMEVRNGVQTDNQNGSLDWDQIEAACRCQPVEACFPFGDDDRELIDSYSRYFQELSSGWSKDSRYPIFAAGFSMPAYGEFTAYWDKGEWEQVQIFKFGLLSYLLPRYLVMMKGDKHFYGAGGNNACAQWSDSNDECISATDGRAMTWKEVYDAAERDKERDNTGNGGIRNMQDYIKVENMPSQSVCARWLGNLEGICATGHPAWRDKIFGISIKDGEWDMFECDESSPPRHLNVYSPGGRGGNWYVLDTISVFDGWRNNFFYYTPPGAQSYVLWSAGPNRRTFPPWVDKTGLVNQRPNDPGNGSRMTIGEWLEDDIVGMKH